MPFSPPIFGWSFLPLVLALYFGLRPQYRNLLLLLASLFFYAWGETILVAILIVSCIANWGFGRWLEACSAPRARRRVLIAGIAFNLGLLVTFKYADWLWSLADPTTALGTLLGGAGALLLDKNGH